MYIVRNAALEGEQLTTRSTRALTVVVVVVEHNSKISCQTVFKQFATIAQHLNSEHGSPQNRVDLPVVVVDIFRLAGCDFLETIKCLLSIKLTKNGNGDKVNLSSVW